MHTFGKNKFKEEEIFFIDSIPLYFEDLYNEKYSDFLNEKPGPKENEFYKNTFRHRPNSSFLWFKAGWNTCFMHNITEADAIPVRKEITNYMKTFLIMYAAKAKDMVETVTLFHEGTIRNAEFVFDINNESYSFKKIRYVLAETTNIKLYAYSILSYIKSVIDNMPLDGKVKAYNFAEKAYMTGYEVNDTHYTYEEYGHMGQNEWISFEGPKENISSLYSGNHIIDMELLIDEYNLIHKKYHDIINIYKDIHDKGNL